MISDTTPDSARHTNDGITIRSAGHGDARAISGIYNHYVKTSIITFEEEPVTTADVCDRIDAVHSASLPWFVAEQSGGLLGYAYATPWKARSAYRFSVEVSAYIDAASTGRGTGSLLYRHLLSALRTREMHLVIAGISLPNETSVTFHEKSGFRKVAHFAEVGFKFGKWIDVGYWQRAL